MLKPWANTRKHCCGNTIYFPQMCCCLATVTHIAAETKISHKCGLINHIHFLHERHCFYILHAQKAKTTS